MKEIDLSKNIKEQFEREGLAYPFQKSNKKWGLRRSSLLDRDTEEESVKAVLDYLSERGIIILKKVTQETLKFCELKGVGKK